MRLSTTENILQSSWTRCWKSLDASGDGLALMQRLALAYEEPQRKYHTAQHLSECLFLMEKNVDLAVESAEVEIGLWFQ
jgi:predicted metal-dependent HD superfamily phosphohydrolase